MTYDEAHWRQQTVDALRERRPSWVIIRHEERRGGRSGVPDVSVSGARRTVWWEFKLADPEFYYRDIQYVTMLRLERLTAARYVIFSAVPEPGVSIVRPSEMDLWVGFPTLHRKGLDPYWAASQMEALQLAEQTT